MSLVAKITVSGDPQLLRDYRGEVNRLLDEEGSGPFRELHTLERLEYEFRVNAGIPFPPFVSASQLFPDVTVEVHWSEAALGRSGRAVIRNGVLAEQGSQGQAPAGAVASHVRASEDGAIELAVCCARWRDGWHGYAITADEHAFFRASGSAESCELSASDGVDAQWANRPLGAIVRSSYTQAAIAGLFFAAQFFCGYLPNQIYYAGAIGLCYLFFAARSWRRLDGRDRSKTVKRQLAMMIVTLAVGVDPRAFTAPGDDQRLDARRDMFGRPARALGE